MGSLRMTENKRLETAAPAMVKRITTFNSWRIFLVDSSLRILWTPVDDMMRGAGIVIAQCERWGGKIGRELSHSRRRSLFSREQLTVRCLFRVCQDHTALGRQPQLPHHIPLFTESPLQLQSQPRYPS